MIGEKLSLLKGIVEEEVLEDANVINKAKRTISFVFYLKYSYLLLLAIRKWWKICKDYKAEIEIYPIKMGK